MGMKGRLKRLEKSRPTPRPPCPECGSNGDPNQPKKFRMYCGPASESGEPLPSDYCSICGRQWRFRMRFDKCG